MVQEPPCPSTLAIWQLTPPMIHIRFSKKVNGYNVRADLKESCTNLFGSSEITTLLSPACDFCKSRIQADMCDAVVLNRGDLDCICGGITHFVELARGTCCQLECN